MVEWYASERLFVDGVAPFFRIIKKYTIGMPKSTMLPCRTAGTSHLLRRRLLIIVRTIIARRDICVNAYWVY